MNNILGLDLGTNSIGWSLVNLEFENKQGSINGLGSRIIPMSQDILGKFDSGQSHSQTAERTGYRGVRRLYQRDNLRRDRLHRVLNVIKFLPEHYTYEIDFENHLGQFKKGKEPKLNYRKDKNGMHEFIFTDSFYEMVKDMKRNQPQLFKLNKNGNESKIPYDWTLYFLRKKALSNKISKEELAWIILNFNQKRGYYQLRGEEEEIEEGKEKSFEILTVKELVDTGETIKGKDVKLYEVIFDNGWKYDKLIANVENWEAKTKEFIVTSSKTKNGEEKRTFKEVDSEKDWIAIKKKTENDIERSRKHIGEYIFDTLLKNPKQKIRGKLIKTIERKYYRKELESILAEQAKHHPELNNRELYHACVNELYPRNEAHQNNIKNKNNFFNYLFIDDIIFYQRPLKSKKSTIGNCQYESGFCTNENGERKKFPLKGISKSHPLYQEFRLWQFLSNLKIYQKEKVVDDKIKMDYDITSELLPDETSWIELFDFLSTKKEIEQHQLLKFFSDKKTIPKQKKEEPDFRWNYPEDKKYPANDTRAQFLSRLQKVEGIVEAEAFLIPKIEKHLWHIIYSVKDKKEFEQALKTFCKTHKLDENTFVQAFIKFPPFKNEYGAYSEKALKKIVPLMRMGRYWNEEDIHSETMDRIDKIITGEYDEKIRNRVREKAINFTSIESFRGLPTWLAGYIVYDRHSETSNITKWEIPADIDLFLNEFKQHSLRNPIVEQVVTETLRVVRDIWNYYGNGAEDFFNEIHIELGREMKNPSDKRKRMAAQNTENENTNLRIKALLQELMEDGVEQVRPYSPSQQEILKIYEEGVYNSQEKENDEIEKIRKNATPSKKDIQRYKLWLQQGYISPYTGVAIQLSKLFTEDYQIEHIIPQSRYFDDSLSNKVICESAVNAEKDNQTAYEFIKNNKGRIIDLGRGKQVKLFDLDAYENHCNYYFKKNRSKLKKLLSEEIPEGFIERQMNDSRYISKLVKGLLSNIVREKDEQESTSKNLITVTGAITSKLKQDWGLNDKWNELILPRFERLNELTNSIEFTSKNSNGVVIPDIPDTISKGFSKKRIDHRHHALDALVIACCTRDHVNYITSINTERKNFSLVSKLREIEEVVIKGEKRKVPKAYKKPWQGFTLSAKNQLEKTIVSFKQNVRVINKTNNKTWQWQEKNGGLVKTLVPQSKGDNWAIRKPLHKATVSGKIEMETPKGKIATATRTALTEIKNEKQIEKIVDKQIREVILPNHLKNYIDDKGNQNFEAAFSHDGVEELNKNIILLNNGKSHQPIYKVPLYEIGSKFSVSENKEGTKSKKYVEAAKGTNLFFAIYRATNKKGEAIRQYETIPLNEVIEHQKQEANLPKEQRTVVSINAEKGELLFTLSPNDLVYVPTDEEMENPGLVDLNNLNKNQVERVYKMVSATSYQCFYIPNSDASEIIKNENGPNNKNERIKDLFSPNSIYDNNGKPVMIKERCWKLKVNRVGNIESILR